LVNAQTVDIQIRDSEPVRAALRAAGELAHSVSWVLTDAVYTAPEDSERRARQHKVLADALTDFRATLAEQAGEQ
jgi:hypothetical protein